MAGRRRISQRDRDRDEFTEGSGTGDSGSIVIRQEHRERAISQTQEILSTIKMRFNLRETIELTRPRGQGISASWEGYSKYCDGRTFDSCIAIVRD